MRKTLFPKFSIAANVIKDMRLSSLRAMLPSLIIYIESQRFSIVSWILRDNIVNIQKVLRCSQKIILNSCYINKNNLIIKIVDRKVVLINHRKIKTISALSFYR